MISRQNRQALFFLLLCPLVHADDWPQFRGPNRDGVSAEKNWSAIWPADGPKRLWKAAVGIGSSGVAVKDGRLFTTGWGNGQETFFCFDAVTGAEIWKHSYASASFNSDHEGGSAATPTADGDVVFTLSRSGHLECCEAASGKIIWAKELTKDFGGKPPFYGYTGSPLILDDKLIVVAGGEGASTIALKKTTGEVIWKSGSDAAAYAAPVAFQIGQRKAVAIFNFAAIVALDAETGREMSRLAWVSISPRKSSINATTPVVSGERLFVTSSYNSSSALLEMNANPPKTLWRTSRFISHYSCPVLREGYLYGFNTFNEFLGRGTLCCIKLDTGETKWWQPDPGWGSLILADGKLIILGRRGELITAEATTAGYKELARAQVLGGTTRAEPALANGRLYIRNVAGDLVCLDLSGK